MPNKRLIKPIKNPPACKFKMQRKMKTKKYNRVLKMQKKKTKNEMQ